MEKNSCNIAIDGISKNFTDEYFNFLNKDVLRSIDFFKSKGKFLVCKNIKKQLLPAYISQYKYLQAVISNKSKTVAVQRLGDMHNGGKCTLLVTIDKDKFIYKPVSVDLLEVLNSVLRVLNTDGFFDFYLLKIVNSSDNLSEIEFINDEKCFDIIRFSYHYGALITVIILLRGVDFHKENLFCVNSTPVVVDCESLFYPELKNIKSYDIYATSMLPTELNTKSVMSHFNLSVDKMIDGVKLCCALIKSNVAAIKDLILLGNNNRKRLIFKPTRFYYEVLRASLHPEFLLDYGKRAKYVKECLNGWHRISRFILESEYFDLMNFDIPYFTYYEDELFNSKFKKIPQDFCANGLNEIYLNLDKIESFQEEIVRRLREYEQRA
ncbi:MAG: DUF4135 domain-containing protein [Gammaproteobacteria bacterium]